jgi:hypothetical protein
LAKKVQWERPGLGHLELAILKIYLSLCFLLDRRRKFNNLALEAQEL